MEKTWRYLSSRKRKNQSMKRKVEQDQDQNLKLGQYPPRGREDHRFRCFDFIYIQADLDGEK